MVANKIRTLGDRIYFLFIMYKALHDFNHARQEKIRIFYESVLKAAKAKFLESSILTIGLG
jgi:hypothetical protein